MTAPPDDTTTDLRAVISALRAERYAGLARETALADELAAQAAAKAARTAEMADRKTEFDERIEHQAATAEVLRVMSASPGDVQPVFDLIVRRAVELCKAQSGGLFEYDGERVHIGTIHGLYEHEGKLVHVHSLHGTEPNIVPASLTAYLKQFPMPPKRGSITMRAILDSQIMHIRDMREVVDLLEDVQRLGHRSQVSVPLLRDARAIGVITMAAHAPGGFFDSQVELLKTFAEQAVIAITSAETYRALQTRTSDLQETLEYQTATSDVLKVISRSTFDLQPVLDTLVETAARLCDADQALISRREGEVMHFAANYGFPPEYETYLKARGPVKLDPGSPTVAHRTLIEGRPVHIDDVTAVPGYPEVFIRLGKHRTSLGVPLLRGGDTIGFIQLSRQQVEPFTDRQIALVSTFADQAVIAIENTRLLTEQQEALEQQTATAEVLEVINSSPGDLVPVFNAMLEKALRLCGAAFGTLYTYDGEHFKPVAFRGVAPGFAELMTKYPPTSRPGSPAARMLETKRPLDVPDLMDEENYRSGVPAARGLVEVGGFRAFINVPLVKDEKVLGLFTIYRNDVGNFSNKQIALLENFAAQAVIAMENARLIGEQREALEQQTATTEVLQVINASPGSLTPVFDAMLEKAHSLCGATVGNLAIYKDGAFHAMATHGFPEQVASLMLHPSLPNAYTLELIRGERFCQIEDIRAIEISPHYLILHALVEHTDVRTVLFVPLRKDGALLGFISVNRPEVRPFSEKEIALLENFAAQAVIAMENARLLTEQQEALEQQTATADVLQVINASPGNLPPVFDTILEKAMRLCSAAFGSLYTYDGGGFRSVAHRGVPRAYAEWRAKVPPSTRTTVPARILEAERSIHVIDVMQEEDYIAGDVVLRKMVELGGIRTALSVPLLKDDVVLGFITIFRQEVQAFSNKQIALLENFAAQAVIAMENARLLTETREALEQQTATAEVLQVINASQGDLTPVFEAILEKAHSLCDIALGSLELYDGERFRAVAVRGLSDAFADMLRLGYPASDNPATRPLIEGGRLSHIHDLAETDYSITQSSVELTAARTLLCVPLRRDDTVLGMIASARREVRPFSEKEIALLENFAAQAVIAMENARLLDEIRQRQEELRVTFENMGDGVAMFDETQHLVAWNGKFQEIFDLPDALLGQHRTYEEHLRFLAARGDFGPGVATVEQINELVASTGQPFGYERTRPDGRVIEIRRNPVPDGGFVLIFSDITERKRSEAEIRAARDAAEEASRTIEAAYRELKAAQASLIQAEKMASLGQLTAGIAHEIKNPLNFVNNFAELSVDLLGELKDAIAPAEPALTEKQRAEVEEVSVMLTSNLEKITEHGRRADSIVKNMLLHSRTGPSEHRAIDVNTTVEEALNLAYHGARAETLGFNITMEKDLDPKAGSIDAFPQEFLRVMLNLISNGFYAARKRANAIEDRSFEPMLHVTTRNLGSQVEIRVRDNGTGIGDEARDKIFEPFFTTKPAGEGTGLGLSLSYDIIVKQHGGQLTVDSRPNEFTEFQIILPRRMAANEGGRA